MVLPTSGLSWLSGMGLLVVVFLPSTATAGESPVWLAEARPADVAMDADGLAKIDGMVAADLTRGQMPGGSHLSLSIACRSTTRLRRNRTAPT